MHTTKLHLSYVYSKLLYILRYKYSHEWLCGQMALITISQLKCNCNASGTAANRKCKLSRYLHCDANPCSQVILVIDTSPIFVLL